MVSQETREMSALKLTTDSKGIVWYLHGSRMPRSSGRCVFDFVRSEAIAGQELIRVTGAYENADLLKELYHARLGDRFQRLEVCSPLCTETEDREDPEVVLFTMRKFHAPVSVGGWHEFNIRDFPSYALSQHFQHTGGDGEYVRRLIQAHPVWPAISFVAGIDGFALANLLSVILDPRWYIHPACELESDRLFHFLGLAGKLPSPQSQRSQRYQWVLDCWKTQPVDSFSPANPHEFLWRTYKLRGGGERGELAASRVFAEFLKQTWTAALCNEVQSQHMFVPKYFFERPDETEAFTHHMCPPKPTE